MSKLEEKLTVWKQNHFALIKKKKRELLARLDGIQHRMHVGGERVYLRKVEHKLHKELNELNYQEELHWCQRSRAAWLHDGDRNTRYYHLKATTRRRKNQILTLRNDVGRGYRGSEGDG